MCCFCVGLFVISAVDLFKKHCLILVNRLLNLMLILLLLILVALYYCYKPVGQVIIGDLGNNDDSGVRSFVSGDLFKGSIAYTVRRMS